MSPGLYEILIDKKDSSFPMNSAALCIGYVFIGMFILSKNPIIYINLNMCFLQFNLEHIDKSPLLNVYDLDNG